MIQINMSKPAKSKVRCGRPAERAAEKGFTYIDVLMGIGVMTIGTLGLMMTLTTAFVTSTNGQQQAMAKQFATSTMESIFSARDINNPLLTNANGSLNFNNIANVANGGIFLNGFNAIYVESNNCDPNLIVPASGPDGIMGTADDSTATTPCPQYPVVQYQNFQRQIQISVLDRDNNNNVTMVKIVVTIQYTFNNLTLQQSMTSYLADYNTQSV